MLNEAAVHLLPTPLAADAERTSSKMPRGNATLLGAAKLLPTPTVADSRGTRNATSGRQEGSQHHSGTTLSDVFWTGPATAQRSADGNPSSVDPHLPLQLWEPEAEKS